MSGANDVIRSEAPAYYHGPVDNCLMCRKWQEDVDLRIVELDYCYVVLNRDQFFAGYCFVLTKAHVSELFHLDVESRQGIIEEVNRVAVALHRAFSPTKINYELLGNMVPHMHWHIVPRFSDDPLWPKPIWSEAHIEKFLAPQEYTARIALIRAALCVNQ
ncbi:MAG: HIT family protein [Deltaproteobacteria bacterium HGW-Deltaproteobacteria-4]|nr:MAG: HIT family protein [Deltaproteobacteria bacterium HGW-Deltaproteobacteria-4]